MMVLLITIKMGSFIQPMVDENQLFVEFQKKRVDK